MVKKMTFGRFRVSYLENKVRLKRYQRLGVLMLIWVISGVVGWVYEFFVALFETGEVYMQGGNFLPWINIYAFGALLVMPVVYKLKKHPLAVFLVSALVTGVVELIGGWLVYTVGRGTRYWNYDHGLWAWGSIYGFVCPLSVAFFGIGAMGLVYGILPACEFLALKVSKRTFLAVAIVLFALVMVDELGNLTLKNLGKPTAVEFYESLGMKYQKF